MIVKERRSIHMARWTLPVKTKRQRLPASLWPQFLLTHIVCPTATTLTDTTTHHQHIDETTVVHVHVIPMVHTCTNDNHRATFGLIRVGCEFSRDFNHICAGYAGDLFLPGRGVGNVLIVAAGNIRIVITIVNTVVGKG